MPPQDTCPTSAPMSAPGSLSLTTCFPGAERVKFKKQDIITVQPDRLYIVRVGHVGVFSANEKGTRQLLNVIPNGCTFHATLAPHPLPGRPTHPLHYEATTNDTVVLIVSMKDWREALRGPHAVNLLLGLHKAHDDAEGARMALIEGLHHTYWRIMTGQHSSRLTRLFWPPAGSMPHVDKLNNKLEELLLG